MRAIDFVIRDGAGALQRGVVPAEDGVTVTLSSGQEVSFNLRQADLAVQQRSGDDLVITLVDGRTITLENYFNDVGVANRVFISADGYLNEVTFFDSPDGGLYAQFGPTEQWGKWSPSDDLIYLGRTEIASPGMIVDDGDGNEVSMLAAALLGGGGLLGAGAAGAAVVGGAALLGGGIGGGDGDGPAAPTVDAVETTTGVGGDGTASHSFDVSGTGEPGDGVSVSAGGVVQTTTVDENGAWSVTFAGDSFPADGSVTTEVTFTHSEGQTVLGGPSFIIDTVGPDVAFTTGVSGAGHVVNGAELSNGTTLTGTGEPGSSIEITIQGVTRTATVTEGGTWSATWQSGTLSEGEYSTDITLVARDAYGNSTTTTETLVVDTVSEVSMSTSTIGGDGTINAAEAAGGVTLTGTTQSGSTVDVTFNGITRAATVDGSGNWSVSFASSEIPTGETQVAVTAVSTDAANNTSTASGMVNVDTIVNAMSFTSSTGGADGVINAAESTSGLVVTGVAEPGSSVVVTLGSATAIATVASDGSWTASFASSAIAQGTYTTQMTATATDAANNTRSVTQAVTVDTEAGVMTIAGPIEGNNIINHQEASDGVMLSGMADPNAVVTVTMGAVTHQATANSSGVWQSFFAASEIPDGTYEAQITATTTDAAGNTATTNATVQIDTSVDNLSVAADVVESNNIISAAERADGSVLTGTTEPGSTVSVTLGTQTVQAVVDDQGNWQAAFSAGQIPEGEYQTNVTVTATDSAGNVATVTDTIEIDTIVSTLDIQDTVTSDDVISGAEAREGISLGGQVERGSTVMVDFEGTVYAASVDDAGNWSLDIPGSAIAGGTYDAAITVMATDAQGNMDTLSDTLHIDTEAPQGPVFTSYTRRGDGLRDITTEQSDGTLSVAMVADDGSISDAPAIQSPDEYIGADGNPVTETKFQFASHVPDGSNLIISTEDAAGNIRGTYVVLDDENVSNELDLSNPALGNYHIDTVDLTFAEEARLTITEAELLGLSDDTNALTILGGQDDTLTIEGAQFKESTTIGDDTFSVYTLGTEGTVILDEDITVNTAIG